MEAHFEDHTTSGAQDFEGSPRKSSTETASGCFDCNICLDYAEDPVVTLCGHLYCWPCIYKWLELETANNPHQCPVCKATLSETTLVPLYGRGNTCNKEPNTNESLHIPRRPAIHQFSHTPTSSLGEPHYPSLHRRRNHHHYLRRRPTHSPYDYINNNTLSLNGVPQLLGSAAISVLPWVFGDHISNTLQYSNRYHHLVDEESSPRQRRREIREGRSLHRLFVFLFCCMMLCLLLF